MRRACSRAVAYASIGCWLAMLASGCGEGASESPAEAHEPQLTQLESRLWPAPRSGATEAHASEGAPSNAAGVSAVAPISDEDDPSCNDSCASKRAECGNVCGKDCGQCRENEQCRNGKCECNSSCDGTRCADACGRSCACAAGTACDDVSGACVPAAACTGPDCVAAPHLPEIPALPDAPIPEPGR